MPLPTEGNSLSAILIIIAMVLAGLSGVPELLLHKRHGAGQRGAALALGLAAVCGGAGTISLLVSGQTVIWQLNWTLPFGPAELRFDPLAALFLIPIFLIGGCGGVYAVDYWPAGRHRSSDLRLHLAYGILVAAMALVVLAGNSALLLLAWELMALAAFFAMTANDRESEVRQAGLTYLIAAHLGALLLFVTFALLATATDSWELPAAGSLSAANPLATAILITGLIGFGAKAGLMPLHFWLPSAHANAPSHVSAIMSGVILKMGIYGIIRLISFFQHPPLWWGVLMLTIGIISGVVGVMFALGQHDIKRLLAYHSIENIGIIAMGIGLSLVGQSIGSAPLQLLGLAGALLHVINHATFKSLLFFAAGAAIHETETRNIDRMGGLAKRLPWTAACFLVGSVAICGLPPLNGFISEFLIYLGAFNGLIGIDSWVAAIPALAAPALALIGTLALACFVKVYGIAFLGHSREALDGDSHDVGWWMRAPMLLLATVCAGIGLLPFILMPILERAAGASDPILQATQLQLNNLAPLYWVAIGNGILLCLVLVIGALFMRRLKQLPTGAAPTWDCGYLAGTPRMQYTASSFAELLVKLNQLFLQPSWHLPQIKGIFPAGSRFASHVPEMVLELCYLPLLRRGQTLVAPLRKLQGGQLHLYVLYLLITLIVLLVWSSQ
jgi:hydrogenase-4 component B